MADPAPGRRDGEVAIDAPPQAASLRIDGSTSVRASNKRMSSVRFETSSVANQPSMAAPLASTLTDDSDDNLDWDHLFDALPPPLWQQHVPKVSSRQFNSLAVPYGPDGPMDLNPAAYSELVPYNYKFLPTMKQSWEQFAARFRARTYVPYLPWWGNRKGYMKDGRMAADALAGLTCAILVIPESLSFMLLASLAPIVGLITSGIAPFSYALFGTSKHVSVGPISLVSIILPSLFLSAGLDPNDHSEAGLADRQEMASVLAFYTFVIFIIMCFLKLGGVVKFVSHDLMTGKKNRDGKGIRFSSSPPLLPSHPPTHPPTHPPQVSSRPRASTSSSRSSST